MTAPDYATTTYSITHTLCKERSDIQMRTRPKLQNMMTDQQPTKIKIKTSCRAVINSSLQSYLE